MQVGEKMKKKYFIIMAIICFFTGISNVLAAANQCTLQDSNKWKYETTLEKELALKEIEENAYDHKFCCTNSNGTSICDLYSAVKANNSGDATEGSSSENTNSNVDYCNGLNSTFVFIGHIVQIAKIFIPIVIIGFGMLDFFKAVIGSKDDEIKKSIKSLVGRCIAGVCIFFLPAVITLIFSWIDGWSAGYEGKTNECFKCIWNVGSCTK